MGLSALTRGIRRVIAMTRSTAHRMARIGMAAVFCLCLSQPVSATDQANDQGTDRDHREINSFRIKIRRLQEGILEKEDQIQDTQSKEQNILSELEILDKKLADQQDKLSELLSKMAKQQELIAREENALARIRDEKGIVENHLKKRIAAYYTMGDIGLLNVTFSTQTLPELLTFHDAFDVLIKYDQDVIKVFRDTIREIERKKTALGLEKTVLQDFITQTANETEILEATKADRRLLLTQVRTQTTLHKKAKEEMQQASDSLSKSIVSLKSKTQEGNDEFASDKGNLPPPIDGRLVTLFRQKKVNKLGIERVSQGIELQGPDNAPVVAVSNGEVIFSGYLRGYGNTVIIHHGQRYYTVTSRLEKLQVKAGQRIKREETIGVMGGTATLFEDGIYFEIRNNTELVDPLLWLNPNRLRATHDLSGDTARKEHSAP
jgi:septal ring factor EnvC (AmiA/AmiB activator)